MSQRTIVTYACDMCQSECGAADGDIEIKISDGDGRDVGPGFIRGRLGVFLPYAVSNGNLCKTCLRAWVAKWLAAP